MKINFKQPKYVIPLIILPFVIFGFFIFGGKTKADTKDKNLEKVETFNLGTGVGSTVLEVIHAFEKVSGQKLPYKIVDRREGDITSAYANTDRANSTLGWKTKLTLEEAMESAWKWEQKVRGV